LGHRLSNPGGSIGADVGDPGRPLLAEDARSDDWTHAGFLARLEAEQADATRNRRLAARLRFARFPFRKTITEFDFEFRPTVDRALVADLATLRFMDTGRPLLFLGQLGCGKTHLAVTIATLAVEAGYRGYFTNAEEMVANIAQATREGNLATKLKTYTAPSVLVIDDVGLLPTDRVAASAFYQVVNRRYEKQHSTIVTTNRGLPDWGEISGDTVVAAAGLDRLTHNAVVFNTRQRGYGLNRRVRGLCSDSSISRNGRRATLRGA
jgi:DNA replication protein DnaC